jgi:hypothetical protein
LLCFLHDCDSTFYGNLGGWREILHCWDIVVVCVCVCVRRSTHSCGGSEETPDCWDILVVGNSMGCHHLFTKLLGIRLWNWKDFRFKGCELKVRIAIIKLVSSR